MAKPKGMYSIKEALNPANYNRFIEYYKNLNYYYAPQQVQTGTKEEYGIIKTPTTNEFGQADYYSTSGIVTKPVFETQYNKVTKPTGYDPSNVPLYEYSRSVQPEGSILGVDTWSPIKNPKYITNTTLPEQVFKDFESHMNYLRIRQPQAAEQEVLEETDQQTKKKEKAKTTSAVATSGAKSLAIPVGGGGKSVGR